MEEGVLEKVKATIIRFNLIKPGERVLLGVSGGVDSVVMLHILNKLGKEMNFSIGVASFDHMLRKESKEEVAFVEGIVKDLALPFFKGKGDVKGIAEKNKKSLEETAREERLKFLFDIKERNEFHKIALAHNLDDFVETFIINLMKGSGVGGIIALKPLSFGGIIHPLLAVEREKIENYAEENKLKYVIDFSNLSLDYLRNKVRQQIVPLLSSTFPGFKKHLFNTTLVLTEEDRFLNFVAEKDLEIVRDGDQYLKIVFERLPLPIKRRIIKEILGKEANFERIERFINFLSLPGRRLNIFEETFLVKDKRNFWLEKKTPFTLENEYGLNIPGETFIEEANLIIMAKISESLPYLDRFTAVFNLEKLELPLRIRFRREGDVILLEKGSKKLQDLFVDYKIKREERHRIPIVVDRSDQILWVVGIRRSTICMVKKTTSKKLILSARFIKK